MNMFVTTYKQASTMTSLRWSLNIVCRKMMIASKICCSMCSGQKFGVTVKSGFTTYIQNKQIDNFFNSDTWFKNTDQTAQDHVQSMEHWHVLDINNRLKREKLKAQDSIWQS